MASPAADRALISLVIDCAARINHDGKSITVISDADAILGWIEQRLEERAARDPLRAASAIAPMELAGGGNRAPLSREAIMRELNELRAAPHGPSARPNGESA